MYFPLITTENDYLQVHEYDSANSTKLSTRYNRKLTDIRDELKTRKPGLMMADL